MGREIKESIDVEFLEQYYLSLMTPAENEKEYISVQTMEKMMLLEIYKILCPVAHNEEETWCEEKNPILKK